MKKLSISLFLISIFTCSYAEVPFGELGAGFDFGINTVHFDSEVAAQNEIDDEGIALTVAGNFRLTIVSLNFGFRTMLVQDYGSFSNDVTTLFGSSSDTLDSDLSIGTLFAEMGVGYDFYERLDLSLAIGAEMISGSRTFEDCYDCDAEYLDIDSGLYIKPTARFLIYKMPNKTMAGETIYLGLFVDYKKALSEQFINDGMNFGLNITSRF